MWPVVDASDTMPHMKASSPSSRRGPLRVRFPFFYGWVILPVASLAMFISGPGQTFSFSVFVDPIREEMGWSQTMIASLYTAGSLTASAGLLVVGRLLDRFGARVMLTAVGLAFGLGALWMSRVNSQLDLYLGFTLMRLLGQGSLTLISTTVVAIWFIRLRGRIMAINSLGAVISQAVFPLLILLLISHFDWRTTWVVLALIIWAMTVLPAIVLVRRSPESIGLLPDGEVGDVPTKATDGAPQRSGEINLSLRDAMRTRAFWLLLFAGSSQALISTALIFNNESLITSKGLDAGVAASIFTVMAPTALVGTFLAGFLLDKYPNRYVLAVAQVLLVAPMLWSFYMAEAWQALVYGGMLGLSGGFFITTTYVIWPNYYGRSELGSIRGVATTAMVAFAALGPMPFAFLFDRYESYTMAMWLFMILPVLCMFAALAAIPPARRGGSHTA